MSESNLTFSYYAEDDNGNTINVTRTLTDDDADYLTTILREFGYYLQSIGFPYVQELVALDCDGNEVGVLDV